jgi:hypothetical protein
VRGEEGGGRAEHTLLASAWSKTISRYLNVRYCDGKYAEMYLNM